MLSYDTGPERPPAGLRPQTGESMYTFESRIRYSEINEYEYLSMEGLINYFQDCSTFQSEDLGIGIDRLKSMDLAWIVNYWQIDVNRYPRLGERVVIGTSPYQLRGFMGLRNFMMETAEGERLVNANSVWSLYNMKKMAPARIPPEISEKYTLSQPFDMEYTSRKIALPGKGEWLSKRERPPITVQEHHLDTNHHVNNVQYVRLALSTLPEGTVIRRLRIMYQKQARLGDRMLPEAFRTSEKTWLVRLNDTGGSPYCVTEVTAF